MTGVHRSPCGSFLGGLLPVYVVHSWEGSSLFMLFSPGKVPPCLCCSVLGGSSLFILFCPLGVLPVYVVQSWEGSSMFVLFGSARAPPCLCCSVLGRLLHVCVVHPVRAPPCLCGSSWEGSSSKAYVVTYTVSQGHRTSSCNIYQHISCHTAVNFFIPCLHMTLAFWKDLHYDLYTRSQCVGLHEMICKTLEENIFKIPNFKFIFG